MHLAVLGATGRTGTHLVRQALERGHTVHALARSTEKAARLLPTDHEQLTVVEGDALDAAAVERVVTGTDAVLNVTGWGKGSPDDLHQRGITLVLDAMRTHGVRRLVTLTGAGVRHETDQPKAVDQIFRLLLKTVQGKMLADSEAYVDVVRASDTNWTVVRGPRLTDASARGAWRVAPGVGKGTGTQISRADLATFMLETTEQATHIRALPVVTW